MTRYFFNFRGGSDEAADEVGCEFETLDLAYLDAYQSMVRIGADLLLEQKDPSLQRIEISNEAGVVLMTLPFDEVFQRRRRASTPQGGTAKLMKQVESSRRLGSDIRLACVETRAVVDAARAVLGKANENGRIRLLQGW